MKNLAWFKKIIVVTGIFTLQFTNMVKRCNNVGVNVIVNFVVNHMSGHGMSGTGTGGSSFNGETESYPAVPYSSHDFHQPYCEINDYHVSDFL